ncbi:MAG TPA: response regulator [Methanoregulaceae archaeon]|nr:response regulator [Methanoregulaceae archaeon]
MTAVQTAPDDQEDNRNFPLRNNSGTYRGRTILLMDDEESILESFGRLLTMKGYTVLAARNGNEALTMYRAAKDAGNRIDVVILDLTIPGGMGGIETIGELRKIDPNVRALVSSGLSREMTMEYSRYGFAGIIPKPYQWTDLLYVIENVLMQK